MRVSKKQSSWSFIRYKKFSLNHTRRKGTKLFSDMNAFERIYKSNQFVIREQTKQTAADPIDHEMIFDEEAGVFGGSYSTFSFVLTYILADDISDKHERLM